jgi:hypothetical protein
MQSVIDFFVAHQVVLVGAAVALLDLVFALVPGWSANGVLHWVYQQLQSLSGKK